MHDFTDRATASATLRRLSTRLRKTADALDLDAERIDRDDLVHSHANLLTSLLDAAAIESTSVADALAQPVTDCPCWSHDKRVETTMLAVEDDGLTHVLEHHGGRSEDGKRGDR